MQIELILNKKNPDKEQINWLTIRNKDENLLIYARYYFLFGSRMGVIYRK